MNHAVDVDSSLYSCVYVTVPVCCCVGWNDVNAADDNTYHAVLLMVCTDAVTSMYLTFKHPVNKAHWLSDVTSLQLLMRWSRGMFSEYKELFCLYTV